MTHFFLAKLNFTFGILSNCDPNKNNANSSFFGLPHWWQYIRTGETDALGRCVPKVDGLNSILPIGLAIVDMLLMLAGLIATISIIVAGVEYISTVGNSEKGVAARKRVVNSIIGLIIAMIATGIVSYIGKNING